MKVEKVAGGLVAQSLSPGKSQHSAGAADLSGLSLVEQGQAGGPQRSASPKSNSGGGCRLARSRNFFFYILFEVLFFFRGGVVAVG